MKKTLRISFEGKSYDVEVEVLDNNQIAPVAVAPVAAASVAPAPAPVAAPVAAPAPAAPAGGTPVPSPMMGIVFKLKVKVGDKVAKNQEVAVLEAMKMENSIISPCDGTVASIAVKEQESVSEGQVLMTIA
ncbi:Biotin carboxyl carrier protein [Fibrobacter intestinalis]|uniref:Biotin carboxyl carrier protein n=1 Tax=Fibrobacter intestinalis TaxID=28122 RepID=A0A1M6VLS0_9BACT|nr:MULTISPECIES: acetyl-CoA carboxylase biotin carboxyl carrier protein subunit [Fibrobacter]MDD7298098.1 acetyl-CoA carboxylase biotin carboxyl carrier protein subunit [Fibrobacter intestinalis]PBC66353.1 biotin carboxyl carrier protein [Fibrobacter sp. UWS1]SHK82452.1 Biotin carboxyl carrier protein [Fibrobacter intestinalis]